MQLVEQGKVDLDADISAYLDFEIERRFDEPLTLRHLLTTQRASMNTAASPRRRTWRPTSRTIRRLRLSRREPLRATPTTAWRWTGYIVQRVSGQPFETYVREHVLEPAGMTTSTYEQPLPAGLAGSLGPGYTSTGEKIPFELMGDFPAGSLTVSAPDFAAFMNAQLSRSPSCCVRRPGSRCGLLGWGRSGSATAPRRGDGSGLLRAYS